MSEEIKMVMKRFYDEVINQKNIDLIDELAADDFVEHEELPIPGLPQNVEGVKAFFKAFTTAFPDLTFTVESMSAEGDRGWARATVRGTNDGEFMGMPATGKKVEFQIIDEARFKGGKVVEHWGVGDNLKMMQQLGLAPEAPAL